MSAERQPSHIQVDIDAIDAIAERLRGLPKLHPSMVAQDLVDEVPELGVPLANRFLPGSNRSLAATAAAWILVMHVEERDNLAVKACLDTALGFDDLREDLEDWLKIADSLPEDRKPGP